MCIQVKQAVSNSAKINFVFYIFRYFDVLILNIILKNKKIYYFNVFLNKKYFEK